MVKCADCGFLAVRNTNTRDLEEAEQDFRTRAYIPMTGDPGRTYARLEKLPLCFVSSFNLQEEIRNKSGKIEVSAENIIEVMNCDRDCPNITKWKTGFTPKEHQDKLDWLINQKWQTDREQSDRDWQHKERSDDKCWRVIELISLVIGAGLFTLLGAWIQGR